MASKKLSVKISYKNINKILINVMYKLQEYIMNFTVLFRI